MMAGRPWSLSIVLDNRRRLLVLCLALCLAQTSAVSDFLTSEQRQDWQAIASGVQTIATDWIYNSAQSLYGSAFAVATDGNLNPFISATRFGAGRVFVLGHEGALNGCCKNLGELGKLIVNAAAWSSSKTSGIRIAGFDYWMSQNAAALATENSGRFSYVGPVDPGALSNAQVDVYMVDGQQSLVGTFAEAIRKFVSNGGGLIIGAQSWYWSYSKDVALHPSNILLAPMGIFISSNLITSNYDFSSGPPSNLGNADIALQGLVAAYSGNITSPYFLQGTQLSTALQAVQGIAYGMDLNSAFWARLRKVEATASGQGGIDPNNPIRRDSVEGLAATIRTIRYQRLPPQNMTEAPDAKYFPGKPPASTKATTVTATITATTITSYWQCLGAWAMAGKVVTVTLPAALATTSGVQFRIGGWTDGLWGHDTWSRLPDISRLYSATGTTTTIGSALGGLIYIILPGGLNLGKQTIKVAGVVKAAVYQAGVTNPSSWASLLASSPAPWGEIGSSKLVITTPKTSLQTVKDPSVVMNYWDKVMDAHAWMANISSVRANPMRIQHDVDISAGYMHSGYPIMTFMDVVNSTLDPVNGGDHWGQFHELGHNHQSDYWTWDCTGEVTVNFFSANAEYTVRKNKDPTNFYGWYGADHTARASGRANFIRGGAVYSQLCGDPGLYLDSFLQVVEASGLGFALLKNTIARYQTMSQTELNSLSSDSAKMQMWIKVQSKVANLNFAPYYASWGWPVTADTFANTSKLPPFKKNPYQPPPPPTPPSPKPPPSPSPKPPSPPRPSPPPIPAAVPMCNDYATLTSGVPSLDTSAIANRLIMWGSAVPLLAFPDTSSQYYAAAARYGRGKAFVIGHEGLMGWTSTSWSRFMTNVALWSVNLSPSSTQSTTVPVCYSGDYWNPWSAFPQRDPRLKAWDMPLSPSQLAGTPCRLYVTTGYNTLTDKEVSDLQTWVYNGGALAIGGHVWGSDLSQPNVQWMGNKVTLPMGILVHTDMLWVAPHTVPTSCPSELNRADVAAKALTTSTSMSSADKTLAADVVAAVKAYVPLTTATASLWVSLNKLSAAS